MMSTRTSLGYIDPEPVRRWEQDNNMTATAAVALMTANGKHLDDIASMFGIEMNELALFCRVHGLPVAKRRPRRMSDKAKAELAARGRARFIAMGKTPRNIIVYGYEFSISQWRKVVGGTTGRYAGTDAEIAAYIRYRFEKIGHDEVLARIAGVQHRPAARHFDIDVREVRAQLKALLLCAREQLYTVPDDEMRVLILEHLRNFMDMRFNAKNRH